MRFGCPHEQLPPVRFAVGLALCSDLPAPDSRATDCWRRAAALDLRTTTAHVPGRWLVPYLPCDARAAAITRQPLYAATLRSCYLPAEHAAVCSWIAATRGLFLYTHTQTTRCRLVTACALRGELKRPADSPFAPLRSGGTPQVHMPRTGRYRVCPYLLPCHRFCPLPRNCTTGLLHTVTRCPFQLPRHADTITDCVYTATVLNHMPSAG